MVTSYSEANPILFIVTLMESKQITYTSRPVKLAVNNVATLLLAQHAVNKDALSVGSLALIDCDTFP